MTWNAAFPSSPLSRSAVKGDASSSSRKASASSSTFKLPGEPRGSGADMWGTTTTTSTASSLLPSPFYSPGTSPTKQNQQPTTSMMASSPPSPRMPFRSSSSRRLSSHLSTSPNPTNLPLVGSYSESLLNGRMSTTPSKPFPFEADIGALGGSLGQTPKHLKLDFEARFYPLPESTASASTSPSPRSFSSSFVSQRCEPPPPPLTMSAATTQAPYVGTIDLDSHYHAVLTSCLDQGSDEAPAIPPFPGYAVPRRGQIQLLIKNTHLNVPVKLFLVPYDLRDMPAGTKTFLRQKIYLEPPSSQPSSPIASRAKRHSLGATTSLFRSDARPKEMLKYAVHLHFASPPVKPTSSKKQASKRRTTSQSLDSWQSRPTTEHSDVEPKIFLHKAIRVVFAPRAPDPEEKINTYYETPAGLAAPALPDAGDAEACQKHKEKKYAPFAGPSSEWDALRRRARLARREKKQQKQRRQSQGSGAGVGELGDAGDLSYASIATSAGDAGEPMVGEGVEDVAMAMDIDVEPSVPLPTAVFEPNSDPNGERWHGQFAGLDDDDGQVKESDVTANRWDASYISRHVEAQRSAGSNAPAAGWPLRSHQHSLQRQRSQTITPAAAATSGQDGRASPLAIVTSMQHRPARSLETASATAPPVSSAAARAISPPSLTRTTAALEPVITTESARAVASPPPSPYSLHHQRAKPGPGQSASDRFSYFLPASQQRSSASLPRPRSPSGVAAAFPSQPRPPPFSQQRASPPLSSAAPLLHDTQGYAGEQDVDDVAMSNADGDRDDDANSAQLLQSWHSQLRRSHARATSQASDGHGGSSGGRDSPASTMQGIKNGSGPGMMPDQPRR